MVRVRASPAGAVPDRSSSRAWPFSGGLRRSWSSSVTSVVETSLMTRTDIRRSFSSRFPRTGRAPRASWPAWLRPAAAAVPLLRLRCSAPGPDPAASVPARFRRRAVACTPLASSSRAAARSRATLSRDGIDVGSSALLDPRPAGYPGPAVRDHPAGLTACAGRTIGLLPGASAHPGTVKIAVSSARPPMHNFAYTWPSASSTVRTATTSRAAIARSTARSPPSWAFSVRAGEADGLVERNQGRSPNAFARRGQRGQPAADAAALAPRPACRCEPAAAAAASAASRLAPSAANEGCDPVKDRAVGSH